MMFIKHNLTKMRSAAKAPAGFRHALWQKLDAQWTANNLPAAPWYQRAWFRLGMGASGVAVVVASLGTGVYAYASPDVASGTLLFPIKQQIESIEEKIQTTPEAKAKFVLKKLARREVEKQVLENKRATKQKVEKAQQQIANVVAELQTSDDVLERTSSTEAHELRSVIKNRIEIETKRAEREKQRLERRQEVEAEKIKNDDTPDATSTPTNRRGIRQDRREQRQQWQNDHSGRGGRSKSDSTTNTSENDN